MLAGWEVTEGGRQPWIVYGRMRVSAAVTGAGGIGWALAATIAIYLGLTIALILILRRMAGGPRPVPPAPPLAPRPGLPPTVPPTAPPVGPAEHPRGEPAIGPDPEAERVPTGPDPTGPDPAPPGSPAPERRRVPVGGPNGGRR
jgi:cytochrome d ubiquinol oxidase subunit I